MKMINFIPRLDDENKKIIFISIFFLGLCYLIRKRIISHDFVVNIIPDDNNACFLSQDLSFLKEIKTGKKIKFLDLLDKSPCKYSKKLGFSEEINNYLFKKNISNNDFEKIISVFLFGYFSVAKRNFSIIDRIDSIICNPYQMRVFFEKDVSRSIISLIWSASELEDIKSISPSKLRKNILKLQKRVVSVIKTGTYPSAPTNSIMERLSKELSECCDENFE